MHTTIIIITLLLSQLHIFYAQNIEVVTEELCSAKKSDETFTWCMNGALNRIPYRLNYAWTYENITYPICEKAGPSSTNLYDECYAIEKVAFGEIENASTANNVYRTARLLFILTTNHQLIIKELNSEMDILKKTLQGSTMDFHKDGMFAIQLGTQKVALIFSDYDTGTNIVWIIYANWSYMEYILKIASNQGCSSIIISTAAFTIDTDTIAIVNSVKQCEKSYIYFSKKIQGELIYYKRILINNDDPNSSVKVKHIKFQQGTVYFDYLVLYDEYTVHILAHSDIEQVVSMDWLDPRRLTTFYSIADNHEGERITNLSPIVLPTESGLNNFWLAIGCTNGRAINTLKIVLLADFNQLDPTRVRVGNPAGKEAPCANPNFYRGPDRRCQLRFSHIHSISIAAEAKIEEVIARNIKPVELQGPRDDVPNIGLALYHDYMKSNKSYTAIFVAAGRRLWVLGLSEKQFESDYGGSIMFDEMISYLYIGKINSLAVSKNGMHVFSSMSRAKYELLSMKRTAEVCSLISGYNATELLLYHMYWDDEIEFDCDRAVSISLNDFLQYASVCPPLGAYCYSFSSSVFRGVHPGYYTVNSYQELLCNEGSYCPGGLGMKLPCPAGYQCPTTGLTSPLTCPASSAKSRTCYRPGMVRPQDCTEGNVCITAYTTPIPAPPGYFTATLMERRGFQTLFKPCELGEYCPLARSVDQDRWCPRSQYCVEPAVTVPNNCPCEVQHDEFDKVTGPYCAYCPGGQHAPDDCPAGFYCETPVSKVRCQPTTYCPNGTKIPLLCPAGYYCPRPHEKHICPEGSYCPIGSIIYINCSPFAVCPEGTSEHNGLEVLIFSAIVAVITAGAWFGLKKWRAHKQKQAESRELKVKQASEKLPGVFKEKTFKVNIAFKDLALSLKKRKKKIISETTGVIRASKLTAILGPSGAGKTAFLETLAGKAHYGEMGGDVFINGMACRIHHLKRLLGYVPPDVRLLLNDELEVLRFSADLRLPRTTTSEQKDQIVNSIIKLLRLTDVQNELIGSVSSRGISGGQRKRVNIGVELVADPTILFLDEPTSGLDSTNGLEVVKILKKVSRYGLTVLAIIHQPRYDIFSMFDEVILFGRGGRILYMGPSKDVLPYFKNLGYECPTHQNPADFILDVICGEVKAKTKEPVDLLSAWKDRFEKEFDDQYKPFFPLPNEVVYESVTDKNDQVSLNDGFVGDNNTHEMTSYRLMTSSSVEDFSVIKPAAKYNTTKPPKRKAASFLRQIWLFGFRFFRQQIKDLFTVITDVLLVLISAIMFGLLFMSANYIGPPPETTCQSLINKDFVERCLYPLADPFPQMALLTGIGLALPAAVAAIRIFMPEKQIYFREASTGSSTVAYFIGKDLAFLPWALVLPLLYLGIWGSFVSYRGNFGWYYIIYLLIYWNAVAIGEIGGIALKSKIASIFTVVAIFVMAMFAGVLPSNREIERLGIGEVYYGSFFRYSTEAFYLTEIRQWQQIYDITSGLRLHRFNIDNYHIDFIVLVFYGLAMRVIACTLMVVLNRDKKR